MTNTNEVINSILNEFNSTISTVNVDGNRLLINFKNSRKLYINDWVNMDKQSIMNTVRNSVITENNSTGSVLLNE